MGLGSTGGCRRGSGPARPAHATPLDTTDATDATDDATLDTAVGAAREMGRLLAQQGPTALARLRPRTVLYLHLTLDTLHTRNGVIRAETVGPLALPELHELLGRDTVVLTPVIDHRDQIPVDAYETPTAMREAIAQRNPYDVFPWGSLPARTADYDHTTPYRPPQRGGPPDQPHPDNLGPLARTHHNAKTHGGFTLEQPSPGVYRWQTPTGHRYQVDHTGTHALGRTPPRADCHRSDLVHSPLEVQLAGLLAG